jgi:hypothetical protein
MQRFVAADSELAAGSRFLLRHSHLRRVRTLCGISERRGVPQKVFGETLRAFGRQIQIGKLRICCSAGQANVIEARSAAASFLSKSPPGTLFRPNSSHPRNSLSTIQRAAVLRGIPVHSPFGEDSADNADDWSSPTATAPAHVRRAQGDHSPPTASAIADRGRQLSAARLNTQTWPLHGRGHCASSRGFGIGACQHAESDGRGVPQRQFGGTPGVQGRSQNQADVLMLASRSNARGRLRNNTQQTSDFPQRFPLLQPITPVYPDCLSISQKLLLKVFEVSQKMFVGQPASCRATFHRNCSCQFPNRDFLFGAIEM